MSQEINNFRAIETAIHNVRLDYKRLSANAREKLAASFDVFFILSQITSKWTKENDSEAYFLEVSAVILRRIVASSVLLESGLGLESRIIIRNVFEYLAILIDIGFNETSFEKWQETGNKTVDEMAQEDWYFGFSKVIKRIVANQENFFPSFEVALAENLKNQWESISNQITHAHSHAQVKRLVSGKGEVQFFALLDEQGYREEFRRYKATLFILVTVLRRNPKMRALLVLHGASAAVNDFVQSYKKTFEDLDFGIPLPPE